MILDSIAYTKQPVSALWNSLSNPSKGAFTTSRSILLTPNRRLAASIDDEFDSQQRKNGYTSWEPLQSWPLNAWFEEAWQRWQQAVLLPDCVFKGEESAYDPSAWSILSPFQEQVLWENVIRESEIGGSLLRVNGSAKLASGAYGLLRNWSIDIEGGWANTSDSELFLSWLTEFRRRCHELKKVCSVDLPDLLRGSSIWPHWFDHIYLYGFDEITPQTNRLFSFLSEYFDTHICIIEADSPEENVSASRVEFETKEEELRYCAKWAKQQLSQHSTQKQNIAIVIPDLQDRRREVERVFRERFDGLPFHKESNEMLAQLARSEDAALGGETAESLFNISGGEILSGYPIISSAFSLLQLVEPKIEFKILSACLSSPFIGGNSKEWSARSQLDVVLRQSRRDGMSLSLLLDKCLAYVSIDEATGESRLLVPGLVSIVQNLSEMLVSNDGKRSFAEKRHPSEWKIQIENVLQSVGWPGDRTLSSQEYQLVSKWGELLKELASADLVAGKVGFQGAISLLRRLANESSFQTETKNQPPIQVLGVLEAAAQNFDAIWMMSLDSETWPPSGYAHPLLPAEMQRKLNMPHSSAQREFEFAKTMTERFAVSASKVIFSSARWAGDKGLNISSLIKGLPEEKNILSDDALADSESFKGRQKRALKDDGIKKIVEVFVRDVSGPVLEQNKSVTGGTWILKAQADCPFKAFASIRLNAKPMAFPVFGATPAERGSEMHKVMEIFWTRCQSHEKLISLDAKELKQWLTEAAVKAVSEQSEKTPEVMSGSVREIEVSRLVRAGEAWLALEAQRTPFKVVAIEEKKEITLSTMRLNTRADRIDRVGDNGYVVIDYKTSEVSTKAWLDERMDEPQLPLYCVSIEADDQLSSVQGVMFGQIKNGKMAIKGQHSDAHSLMDKKSRDVVVDGQWGLTLSQWAQRLDSLAKEFTDGYAEVMPKSLLKSCRYCDLQPLCRVSEVTLEQQSPQEQTEKERPQEQQISQPQPDLTGEAS